MVSTELLKEFGFKKEEKMEIEDHYFDKTGFPEPVHRYRWVMEGYSASIEETYFHVLDYLREEYGFPHVDKITDVFTAAENSAFFGVSVQRLGIYQDKVSQFLATIGKMVKELFQLVRELRVIDERLNFYNDSYTSSKSSVSAEITLKGIWIDLVEQGSKNPASVYGMARELGFATLPDLFFQVHAIKGSDVDVEVDKLDFNNKVKEVLKRKLRTYLEWKEATFKELRSKRIFTLKYLRQHYDIIKMYITWVKPYLRIIKRIQMRESNFKEPDLITAFENSMIEVEVMFKHHAREEGLGHHFDLWAIILGTFDFRTRPSMSYVQEGYQRGPIHVGRVEVCLRGYLWNKDQIAKYKAMKEKEDMELMVTVDESLKVAMDSLGEELEKYLKEAGEKFDKKEDSEPKKPKGDFAQIFEGFAGLFKKEKEKPGAHAEHEHLLQTNTLIEKKTKDHLKMTMWEAYKNYKKTHGMLAW